MSKGSDKAKKDFIKENVDIPAGFGRPMGPGMGGGGHTRGGIMGGARMMPVVKPRDFKGTMLRLWKYFGTERKYLTIVFLLILISIGIGLIIPRLLGTAIDTMTSNNGRVDFDFLKIFILALAIAFAIDALLSFSQGWLMAGISQRIVKHLRKILFAKLHKLPISFFDLRTHGDLMSRLTNDIDNISTSVSQSTTQLLSNTLAIAGSLVMMLLLSPILTLAALITFPLILLLSKAVVSRTRLLFKEQQATLGKLNGHIEENISGIHVVKAFNHEEQIINQFDNINSKLCNIGIKAQVWSGFMMPLMNVINNLGFASIAAVGGVLASRDMITIGVIASFISYSKQFGRPLNDIANIYNTLQTAVAGAERVFEILEEKEEIIDPPDAMTLINPKGHIVFNDVYFSYRSDVPVLKNISFEAVPGNTIALVGPTGSGKTTIVNLLSRFYDVSEGSISIDGLDIRNYTRSSLHNCFGIVLQDTCLFNGTVRENIKYGSLDASDIEMIAAAKMANAHTFISRLPKGYDTILFENGSNLSQGQRQLLAIARAILSNPSILILDEATSSVDTRTELHIQDAMRELMKGRTSFIIAHRLSTIRDADLIIVIDKGRIIEKGNHNELMTRKGEYFQMVASQLENTYET
jgi:ATP-binding cassette subfamily B multidrug efflux pump